jgi:hypothetical protein
MSPKPTPNNETPVHGAEHERLGVLRRNNSQRPYDAIGDNASFDLEEIREMHADWGVFRDRRPDA